MKVIAYSAHTRPEIFTVKNTRDAKRLAARLKHHEQKLASIYTEREYIKYLNSDEMTLSA